MKVILSFMFMLSVLAMSVFPIPVCAANPPSYPENHCLRFDGTDDYVSCGSLDVEVYKAENFTVEFWIKPKYTIEDGSDGDYGHTFGALVSYTETWAGDGGWTLYFDFSNGYLYFGYVYWSDVGLYPGPRTYTVSTNREFWNASSWYHVAFTYDPSSLVFYVNGTVDKIHTDVRALLYEDANLKIGGHPTYGYMFGGLIDEVRVWNVPMTHDEILATLNRVLNLTECAQRELIGYWRFDEGSGDISEDHSTQANNVMLALPPYTPTWVDFGAPIIPEFPSILTLPLLMILTLLIIVFLKKTKPQIH